MRFNQAIRSNGNGNGYRQSGAVLNDEALHRLVPSAFALEPWQKMSDRYRFIPTIDVIRKLRDEGFFPVFARQGNTRIEGKGDFTKHLLRFRPAAHVGVTAVGSLIPELVMFNSHDGTSGYNLYLGLFRSVCENSLIVNAGDILSMKARHSGHADLANTVIEGSYSIIEQAPAAIEHASRWTGVMVAPEQQVAFAEAALEVRETALQVPAGELLRARRHDDAPDGRDGITRNLWRTFNVLQENVMRGGLRGVGATGRRNQTRPVNAPQDDVRMNRALFALTARMESLITGVASPAEVKPEQLAEAA